jgi:hypothetical protein
MDAAAQVPSWITLLIQVPLVGVFIWYSLEMAKRSAESQRAICSSKKRDEERIRIAPSFHPPLIPAF